MWNAMEYYSAIKRNEIISFTRKWMEVGINVLGKVIQVQKGKVCMFSLICGRQI
jgi:hypothetical protein